MAPSAANRYHPRVAPPPARPTMNPSECGHPNREGARFCGECGLPVRARTCTRCGSAAPPGGRFCDACGEPLGPAGGPRAEPRTYTPRHLAEKILNRRSAIEGERKQVTVLFADVQGSMDLSASVDPEEWHRILDRFFAILSDGVHRFEGTINQFTGDGVMALFGAPLAHEDHAQRACYAALALAEDLAVYSAELRRDRGLNFAVRMGLNSGEVIVGKIGDDLRMDYTAQGPTVGLAARMEQLAAADRIYVTEATAALVAGWFRLDDLGEFRVRGVREPVRVYELRGVGAPQTRLEIAKERGFSRFVGREREVRELDDAVAKMLDGRGQIVAIVGESGVGKSRLCHELTTRLRARGIAVHEGHGVSHGRSVPFLPVLELLRSYFGIRPEDDDDEARRKIAGTLVLIDDRLREELPVLFELFGIAGASPAAGRMDPEARQRRLFAMLARLVQARSRRAPAAIVVEDLHWVDGATEAYLATLAEAIADTRTLLLVNFRPEYSAAWLSKPYARTIRLDPLAPPETRDLLRELLGEEPSVAELAARIQERTGGNPFFVEETVRSLVESGALEGERGRRRLARPIEVPVLPVTVQSVLAARIDRLGEREKAVLQTAAVVGKEVSASVLARVCGLPPAELDQALGALVAADFLDERSLHPEAVYAFRHPLTLEVAYHSQLSERRTRVHGEVAHAIAALYPDRLGPMSGLLAHHAERAGDLLGAARWSRRAAEWAADKNFAEAARHWRAVRDLTDRVPERDPEVLLLGILARLGSISLSIRLGDRELPNSVLYAEGLALAEAVGDPRWTGLLETAYAAALTSSGEVHASVAHAEEAMRIAHELGDPELVLAFSVPLVYAYDAVGRLREALEAADRRLAEPPADLRAGSAFLGFSPYLQLMFFRGMILSFLGRLGEARRQLDRTIALARDAGELEVLGFCHGSYTLLARSLGDADLAERHAREGLEIAERIGSALSRAFAYRALGVAHSMRGRWEEAVAALETAARIRTESHTMVWEEGFNLADLAEAYWQRGEPERALEAARRAAEIVDRRGAKALESYVQVALARVLLGVRGAGAEAEVRAAVARALDAVRATGQRSTEPFALLEAGRLELALGRRAPAVRELREALRLFRAMDATGREAAVAAELAALGGSVAEAEPAAESDPG